MKSASYVRPFPIIFCVILFGCGDESRTPQVADVWEPSSYGTFITDACGVGLSNFGESRWDHREGSSTLHLEMAQGCGVYQGTIEFREIQEFPHMSPWVVATQMCNRCSEPRFLSWVRLRGYDELDSPMKDPPLGGNLSFGVDYDGIQGPDSGDGLSGFIRYLDRNDSEYLTQCRMVVPFQDGTQDLGPIGKVVHQLEVRPGEWVSTNTGWRARSLFDSTITSQRYVETLPNGERVFEQWPQPRYQPVDFDNLESTSYLWPRFHAQPSEVVADFPFAQCEEFGYSSYDHLWDNEPLGGTLVKDRGYQDWIPQEFEFEISDVFKEAYKPWENRLPLPPERTLND